MRLVGVVKKTIFVIAAVIGLKSFAELDPVDQALLKLNAVTYDLSDISVDGDVIMDMVWVALQALQQAHQINSMLHRGIQKVHITKGGDLRYDAQTSTLFFPIKLKQVQLTT